MADIDKIEELMCKHDIDATATVDKDGYYTGYYQVDGDDFLEVLEQAEREEELEELKSHYGKQIQELTRHNDINRDRAKRYKGFLVEIAKARAGGIGHFISVTEKILDESLEWSESE